MHNPDSMSLTIDVLHRCMWYTTHDQLVCVIPPHTPPYTPDMDKQMVRIFSLTDGKIIRDHIGMMARTGSVGCFDYR